MLTIAPGNPLVSMSIAVNILAGIAPDQLPRVTAIATGGLDALPHNGAVITLLGNCGLSHRKAYLNIFVVVVLGSALGSF